MNKTRFYKITIGCLLLTNLLLVYVNLVKKSHGENHSPQSIIIERLDLDHEQVETYQDMIHGHRQKVKEQADEIKHIKNKLYSQLGGEIDTVYSDSMIANIANHQQAIEALNFNHFEDLKHLCKPDQLPKFEKLSRDLGRIFEPKRPPRR